jgi:hypothetical protein
MDLSLISTAELLSYLKALLLWKNMAGLFAICEDGTKISLKKPEFEQYRSKISQQAAFLDTGVSNLVHENNLLDSSFFLLVAGVLNDGSLTVSVRANRDPQEALKKLTEELM